MKKSEIRFDEPIRQSYVAILLLIYKRFKLLIRQIWPLLLVFLFGGEQSRFKNLALMGLIGAGVISIIFAVIGYFRFFFYVKGDELVVQKGVLNKKYINIPFDRIQTINFEQNVVQQMFDVVGLKIDTAGSKNNEFNFEALDKPTAVALRDLVMKEKRKLAKIIEDESDVTEVPEKVEKILHLNLMDLLKVGATQNHLRSFGLILLFFGWMYENLDNAGVSTDQVTSFVPEVDVNNYQVLILILVPIFMLVSFLISIFVTSFKYFDLQLLRGHNGFKVISGLLNRKEVAAMDNKIQMISWRNNPLKKLLGIYDVQFRQASSVEVQAKKSINVPGCHDHHIQEVKNHYFEEGSFDHLDRHRISHLYVFRQIIYIGLVPAALATVIIFFLFPDRLGYYAFPLIWFVWMVMSAFIRHRKMFYSLNGLVVFTGKGMFGNLYNVMKLYKVQNVKIVRSIYQRRHDLADVQLFTAAGSIRIPYIEYDKARAIRDYVLYKVESDGRSWM